jgi:carboxylate-amine ligase
VTLPEWARWRDGAEDWTLGAEEEVMLLDPSGWQLAQVLDEVHPRLSPGLAAHVCAETHAGALELTTGVHRTAGAAAAELAGLRGRLAAELAPLGLRAAAAGTHPTAMWQDTRVSAGARYQLLHRSMRELARREPTFALHVHVGIADGEAALDVANRLRAHLPLLLALSANSPFWQGRDSGLASSRTPVFGTFPRTGIPRRYDSLEDWARAVHPLILAAAIPEPTFLWWDVRLQPRLGTVEVRVMDAQTTTAETAGLIALVHALARLEATDRFAPEALVDAPEVLSENRFLAARDGMGAAFVVPGRSDRLPARELLGDVLAAARPHAEALGSAAELDLVEQLAQTPGADRQRAGGERDLVDVVREMADVFTASHAPLIEPVGAA